MQSGTVANQVTTYALRPEVLSRLNTACMTCAFLGGSVGSWLGARAYARSGMLRVYALLASLCTLAQARHRFHPRRAVVPASRGNAEEIPSLSETQIPLRWFGRLADLVGGRESSARRHRPPACLARSRAPCSARGFGRPAGRLTGAPVCGTLGAKTQDRGEEDAPSFRVYPEGNFRLLEGHEAP